MISTQHLFPSALPTPAAPLETPTTTQNNEGQNAALNGNAMQLETATAVEVVDSASGMFSSRLSIITTLTVFSSLCNHRYSARHNGHFRR